MRLTAGLLLVLIAVSGAVAQDTAGTEQEPTDKPAEKTADGQKPETLDELLARIEKEHKQHKDFKGNFEQTRYLPLFDDTVKSSGRFVFKRPDQVRWEYSKPHKSILVVSGNSGRKWSESTRKVEAFKLADDRGLDAVVKQLFTWFKGEFTKLKNDYEVERKAGDSLTLVMKPKNESVQKYIATIEVTFTEDGKQIAGVKLTEPQQKGDKQPGYTQYEFKDTELDSDVGDAEFEITP